MRKVHINNQEWQYHIGQGTVVIQSPDGKKSYHKIHLVKGVCEPDIIDRGRYKRTSDGMVKPSEVKNYIENFLTTH